MKTSAPDNQAQGLRFLPRDRKTLDYILSKLAVNSSPERFDLLQELFEMHRTSIGFDPAILSKGRFKRFKAFEIRQVLAELEQELAVILSSDEFTPTTESNKSYKELFNQYLSHLELVTAPPSKSLNDQIDSFCRQLMQEGAYELLLSFYRQAYHHFSSRNVRIDQVITDYYHLTEALDYHNAFTLTGLQTVQIVADTYQGNTSQEELLLHLSTLKKLIQRAASPAGLYELKARAARIALLLERRTDIISELTHDIYTARKKRIMHNDELEAELVCATAYSYEIANEDKLEVFAIQSLNKSLSPLRIIHTKLAEALVNASEDQITKAKIYINEAEHLLIRNSFKTVQMKNAWMEMQLLRFFIYMMEELRGVSSYEKAEYQIIIQAVKDISDDIRFARTVSEALYAILCCIKKETEMASTLISEWLEGNKTAGYLAGIMECVSELTSEKSAPKKLKAAFSNLEKMNEPFYSTVFNKVLKNADLYKTK